MEPLWGLSARELAALAGVNRTTASRWKRGRSRVPPAVLALAAWRLYGELEGILGPAWRGWRAGRDGRLYAPAWRRGFTPDEILAMPFLYRQISAIERHLRAVLRARRLDYHHARRRARRRR